MKTDYDHLPHVEFVDGSRIYYPEQKLETLKTEDFWTVSKVMRKFKLYHRGALMLITYAQEEGVLSENTDKYERYEVLC